MVDLVDIGDWCSYKLISVTGNEKHASVSYGQLKTALDDALLDALLSEEEIAIIHIIPEFV